MLEPVNRRKFLKQSVKVGSAVTLSATLMQLSACSSEAKPRPISQLIRDPNGVCDLPAGFSYKVISAYDEVMTDGHMVPDYHDGMGCFSGPNDEIILVRNHEIAGYLFNDPESPEPEYAYDPKASGGTVTIWLDQDLNLIKHYLSLTGTIVNCSGGKTPWNTWISCEEASPAMFGDTWFMGKRHGYNFEVDPLKPLQKAQPLKAMGRFKHEAVAFDPFSGNVYQTEDHMNGCFYQFIPTDKTDLVKGGELQALKFKDAGITHTTENPLTLHQKYPCEWVAIDEPDPEENNVRKQGKAKGAAVFMRGEGLVAHQDGVYFVCTAGGSHNKGQIFKYTANQENNEGIIELIYEAKEDGILEKPDNITVNAWGDLIICEDNSLEQKCLVGLTAEGQIYHIAANSQAEWAGACFSPDGNTLFANIHKDPGMTIAIKGPWGKLRVQS
ncbi:alkaline phosphatase PhoX [Marinicella litoralis]|uniref:Secreted PhoX family phosphatase n=1 Tax=Marinicella litoralis TaxID=644220 RepID=A0A4V3DIX5_9GAMM|nr:alkaline phosphatase PhoX [Marinicella litoralis]TDR23571.1 hypothetical protein C8D91_0434 [Marinicella litoralis]